MRTFLSYGHDEYASLAVCIKRDLEAQGHEVWFDLDRLKVGRDWEQYIDDGLDFTSAVPDAGRFLLLMTPHSVRRPNGYCLNELARAFNRNLPVIPVMVSTVEPPLSISRLQWLDMRSCFPVEKHEELYNRQFGQLMKALEEKQVPFEGVQQRLLNYLQPISYDDDLTRHLLRFTGREWLMKEVEEWLDSSHRTLWITGEAGVGKSALAAWLCNQRPEIAAYHFCHFGNSDRTDARKTLFSLAYQLSTQISVYRQRLNASPLDKTLVETNALAIFDRLFIDLLKDHGPLADKCHVLLIDALDEASRNGRNELASIIAHGFDRLPQWLRVIVTSRPHEKEINFALQALDPWKLDAGRAENVSDIRAYLNRELRRFTAQEPSSEVVDQVVQKSEGLFLYVSWVRQELENGRLSLSQIDEFPRGLGGVYADFFQRYYPDVDEYTSKCRPALEVICAAREPLDRRDLISILDQSEYEMRLLTARLGSLFPVTDGKVRTFHQSVRDWLVEPDRSGDYYVEVDAGETRLADFVWRQYKTGFHAMSDYCIKYAPSHFAACRRIIELEELLLNPAWIQAKLRTSGVAHLLADYGVVFGTVGYASTTEPAFNDASQVGALEMIQCALRLSSHVIGRDPAQFPSQMVGRLLPHQDLPAIEEFTSRIGECAGQRWLRPVRANLQSPEGSLLRTLQGHRAAIVSIAISVDGSRAISGSQDETLKVWDVESGRELRMVGDYGGSVGGVAMSGDGRLAVYASSLENALKVWDVESGCVLCTLKGHTDSVNGVALTADGRCAISASDDKTLKVWDVKTGLEMHTLQGHTHAVQCVAMSADGRLAVSTSYYILEVTLKVWDVDSGRELMTMEGRTGSVHGLAVTADGRLGISASDDGTLKVWDLNSGHELKTLKGHEGRVYGVVVTADGHCALSASDDETLKVWNVETGEQLRTLSAYGSSIYGVAVSRDWHRALSASEDGTLKVWDVAVTGGEPHTLRDHASKVNSVAVSARGRCAVSASEDKTLKVWNVSTGQELRTLRGHASAVLDVALSTDGRCAVSASSDKTLKVWNVDTGQELRSLHGHASVVYGVALSADGRCAVSASSDKTLKVWNVETGLELRTLSGHNASVYAVVLSEDGRRAISASSDSTVKIWDVESGEELHSLAGHSIFVSDVTLSRDGRRIVSASGDNTLKVWDVKTGLELRTLRGHTRPVEGVAVSADGRCVVSASQDKTLRMWDIDAGVQIATFTCDAAAHCCAFVADDLLIAGDSGGRVHLLCLEEVKSRT